MLSFAAVCIAGYFQTLEKASETNKSKQLRTIVLYYVTPNKQVYKI